MDDELEQLIQVLPAPLQHAVRGLPSKYLLEVVMDLGRLPEARLTDRAVRLSADPVRREDIDHVLVQLSPVGEDNRTGIPGTLHRISVLRNRRGTVVGLTLRVGRAVVGTIDMLRDLIDSGRNVLLLGRPGVGKTTKLREIARVLADEFHRRVVVVDTSNEIGGDGDIPHPGIGSARRMQVPHPDRQHAVMIEAVENHMPEVIVIDEIGTREEALAARTIAERGVQLIATAHGNTLENLVLNPTLSDLVGGVHTVTLSDEEARRRHSPKTITERRGPPTFDMVVEMVDRDEVVVHRDTAEAVDRLLAGRPVGGEHRQRVAGRVEIQTLRRAVAPLPPAVPTPTVRESPVKIFPHAIRRDLFVRALREVTTEVQLVDDPEQADVIVSLQSRADDPRIRRLVGQGKRIYTVKKNSTTEMRRALRLAVPTVAGFDEAIVRDALMETEHAIARVMSEGVTVALAPRPAPLRKVQHRLISRYHLEAHSVGSEPMRHLVIHPAERREESREESLEERAMGQLQ